MGTGKGKKKVSLKELNKPPFTKQGYYSVSRNGYRINRPLLFGWAILIAILVVKSFIFLNSNGGFYLNCPGEEKRPCDNPYHDSPYLCNKMNRVTGGQYYFLCEQELLQPGETYGEKPPFYMLNIGLLFLVSLAVTLILNHFLYNDKLKVKL